MNIDELKTRVASAIELFTLVDERNLDFCRRFMDALDAIEGRHRETQSDLEQVEAEVERLTQENQQLRVLLQAMIVAADSDRKNTLADLRGRLERRVNELAQPAATSNGPGDRAPAARVDAPSFDMPGDAVQDIVERVSRVSHANSPAQDKTV